MQSLIEKVLFDVENARIETAIQRLTGALEHQPLNNDQQWLLAKLYYGQGQLVKAGRYFYFKPNASASETACIEAFKRSLGNDPLLILKKLVNKTHFRISSADMYTKQVIADLIRQIQYTHDVIPGFASGIYRHLQTNTDLPTPHNHQL